MKRVVNTRMRRRIIVPRDCYFCKSKLEPTYSEAEVLRRFLTDRGKIIGKARTGICAKHQRRLTTAIKHARHLALVPFIGRY